MVLVLILMLVVAPALRVDKQTIATLLVPRGQSRVLEVSCFRVASTTRILRLCTRSVYQLLVAFARLTLKYSSGAICGEPTSASALVARRCACARIDGDENSWSCRRELRQCCSWCHLSSSCSRRTCARRLLRAAAREPARQREAVSARSRAGRADGPSLAARRGSAGRTLQVRSSFSAENLQITLIV